MSSGPSWPRTPATWSGDISVPDARAAIGRRVRRRRRRLVAAALAVTAVAGSAGALVAVGGSGPDVRISTEPSLPSTTSTSPSGVVEDGLLRLLPRSVPAGMELADLSDPIGSSSVVGGPEWDLSQRWIRFDAGQHPESIIDVSVDTDPATAAMFQGVPLTVHGQPGVFDLGMNGVAWTEPDGRFVLVTSAGMARADLEAIAATFHDDPAADFAIDPPAGYEHVVSFTTARSTGPWPRSVRFQSGDGARELELLIDEPVGTTPALDLYLPDSQRLTVRGVDAVLTPSSFGIPGMSTTGDLVLEWDEGGSMVSLSARGLTREEVLAIAESLRPATAAEWDALDPTPGERVLASTPTVPPVEADSTWVDVSFGGLTVTVPPEWIDAGRACAGDADGCDLPADGSWVWLAPVSAVASRAEGCGGGSIGDIPICQSWDFDTRIETLFVDGAGAAIVVHHSPAPEEHAVIESYRYTDPSTTPPAADPADDAAFVAEAAVGSRTGSPTTGAVSTTAGGAVALTRYHVFTTDGATFVVDVSHRWNLGTRRGEWYVSAVLEVGSDVPEASVATAPRHFVLEGVEYEITCQIVRDEEVQRLVGASAASGPPLDVARTGNGALAASRSANPDCPVHVGDRYSNWWLAVPSG